MTSWVAIDETRKVTGPTRDQVVPQELPYGTSATAFGLRGPARQTATGGLVGAVAKAMAIGTGSVDLSRASTSSFEKESRFDLDEDRDEPYGAPAAASYDRSAPYDQGEADESDDELDAAAPRSVDVDDYLAAPDAMLSRRAPESVVRYSGGKAAEEEGDFSDEEATGQVSPPPPPAEVDAAPAVYSIAPRAPQMADKADESGAARQRSVADTKKMTKGEAPGAPSAPRGPSAGRDPGPPSAPPAPSAPSAQAPRRAKLDISPSLGRRSSAPLEQQQMPAQMTTPTTEIPPARQKRRSRLAPALWLTVILAVIAMLLWWLLS
jgi:hypothetical protein